MVGYDDSYNDLLKALADFRKKHDDEFVKHVREFANRVALTGDHQRSLLGEFAKAFDVLHEKINDLRAQHGISDRFITDDPVLRELQALLDGKTGGPLSAEEEQAAREEATQRIESEKPPGFKDAGKDDPCGDYLLWHQSLKEAKLRQKPLLFVTRDSKSDWFLTLKGRTISALPDLVKEAYDIAGVDFVAMATRSFLIYAQSILKTQVSESTLKQSDAIRQSLSHSKKKHFFISEELGDQLLAQALQDRALSSERLDRINRAIQLNSGNPKMEAELKTASRVAGRVQVQLDLNDLFISTLRGASKMRGTLRLEMSDWLPDEIARRQARIVQQEDDPSSEPKSSINGVVDQEPPLVD
ncbi:hypothetical protein GCM10010432_38690 [Catellatospora methionotrophica]